VHSAAQVDAVTAWPDFPSEILCQAPGTYARNQVWDATQAAAAAVRGVLEQLGGPAG
jgi:hypothetical protein